MSDETPDPKKLLHALVNPADMIARCGFEFQLDKPAGLLNAEPEDVCHECAVMAYAAAENRNSELAKELAAAIKELDEARIERDEARQWIDSEPDWKDKYNANYIKLHKALEVAQRELGQLKTEIAALSVIMRQAADVFAKYEMSVDYYPTIEHRDFMQYLTALQPNPDESKGEEGK